MDVSRRHALETRPLQINLHPRKNPLLLLHSIVFYNIIVLIGRGDRELQLLLQYGRGDAKLHSVGETLLHSCQRLIIRD
jgi:hypothetical protein